MPISKIFALRDLTAMIFSMDHRAWLVAPREVLCDAKLRAIAWGTFLLQLNDLSSISGEFSTEPLSETSDLG